MGNFGHQNGFEGVSVAVSYSDIAAPDLWSQSNEQEASGPQPVLQRSVLSFRFPYEESRVYSGTAPEPVRSKISRVVQLPVANTLFHNGQPSTMFATRWVSSTDPMPRNEYMRTRKINLAQQTLNMVGMLADDDLRHRSKLFLGLQPITVPRVIAAGLGNIVRELYVGRESKVTVPASEELENAISREIENSKNPDQRPGVWALITPRKRWVDEPQIGTPNAAHWIERGSRLHRILSGGGGWGMKKGLLALDPETNFHSPQLEAYQASEDGEATDGKLGQALEGIIRPGDIITFFLFSKSSEKSRPKKRDKKLAPTRRDWHVNSPPSVCFGSAPSTADVAPNQSTATGEEEPRFRRILIARHFGMLSEQGMSLHADREAPADSMEQSGAVVHTKIDNPFAYFSITCRGHSQICPTLEDGTPLERGVGVMLTGSTENQIGDKPDSESENAVETTQDPVIKQPRRSAFRLLRYKSDGSTKRDKAADLHVRYHVMRVKEGADFILFR